MSAPAMNTEMFQNGLTMYKEMTEAYMSLMMENTQEALKFGIAVREGMGQVMAEGLKQAEALTAQQQELAMSTMEKINAQNKVAAEKVTALFNAPAA